MKKQQTKTEDLSALLQRLRTTAHQRPTPGYGSPDASGHQVAQHPS